MFISASRRSDLPAFYSEWFMNRVRAGNCTVPNPFNREQVSRISLTPDDVDCIGFWTRNPRPMFRYLDELHGLGHRYYFHQTIVNNPRAIDPHSPAVEGAVRTFRELSARLGPDRVIWRYDPIVFSSVTPAEHHLRNFGKLVRELGGHTRRCIISILDFYRKAQRRMGDLAQAGLLFSPPGPELGRLITAMVEMAGERGIEVVSCAEPIDLTPYGVRPGRCVDGEYAAGLFGVNPPLNKDPNQREACDCTTSRDVGMYDSCLFGCAYCYATSSFARSRGNYAAHDPRSPSMFGWYEADEGRQPSLFAEGLRWPASP